MLSSCAWGANRNGPPHSATRVIPARVTESYLRVMRTRLTLLVLVFAGLLTLNPDWLVPDWSQPGQWLTVSRPEDAVAALLRLAALLLTGTQIGALAVAAVAGRLGRGGLERLARRALLPVFRTAAPLALVAGAALPVAAMETRLPVTPPAVERVHDAAPAAAGTSGIVVVAPGDSLWTIAAARVEGDPSAYWRRIVELNERRFDDVNLIHPGDTVLIPPVTRAG